MQAVSTNAAAAIVAPNRFLMTSPSGLADLSDEVAV